MLIQLKNLLHLAYKQGQLDEKPEPFHWHLLHGTLFWLYPFLVVSFQSIGSNEFVSEGVWNRMLHKIFDHSHSLQHRYMHSVKGTLNIILWMFPSFHWYNRLEIMLVGEISLLLGDYCNYWIMTFVWINNLHLAKQIILKLVSLQIIRIVPGFSHPISFSPWIKYASSVLEFVKICSNTRFLIVKS